jgi:hypothetical protein
MKRTAKDIKWCAILCKSGVWKVFSWLGEPPACASWQRFFTKKEAERYCKIRNNPQKQYKDFYKNN